MEENCQHLEYIQKCEKILDWSQRKPKFNNEFVKSVLKFIEENNYISEKQIQCVDKIITKFKI